MRPLEARHALEKGDAIAPQLGPDHVALGAHHVMRAEQQILDPHLALGSERFAVQRALAPAGEVDHRLAQCLAGNGPGVDADAADVVLFLAHRHALTELGGLGRGALAAGTAADDDQIEVVHAGLL